MKAIHIGALILLGAIWGASFLFIREAAHDFGPIVLMFLRVFFAGLALIPVALFLSKSKQGQNSPKLISHWRELLIMGALNSAIPFTLIAFSELTITASLASILNSLTPLFTTFIAAIWIGEQLTGQKILGAVLGIVGVMVLVGGSPLEMNAEFLLAVVASIVAAIFYGLASVYASLHIKGLSAIQASIGQLFGASAVLAIPSVATIPDSAPSMRAIVSLVALILLSTSCAYLIYFYLLRNIGPTRTVSVTFLVPVFGTVWGIAFLNEPFSWGMLLGMAIILLSVGLVLGAKFEKKKPVVATS